MSTARNNNLFDIINRMDRGELRFFTEKPMEYFEGVSPYFVLLWVRGATNNEDLHIMDTNLVANKYMFALANHPRLLFQLLCVANGGYGKGYYKFIKTPKGLADIDVVARYYDCGMREARLYAKSLTEEDITVMKDELGIEE